MAVQVPCLSAEDLTYDAFTHYMATNTPVLITDALDSMPVFKDWAQSDGSLNAGLLAARYGRMAVPVVDCATRGSYGEQWRTTMTLAEFLRRAGSTPEAMAPATTHTTGCACPAGAAACDGTGNNTGSSGGSGSSGSGGSGTDTGSSGDGSGGAGSSGDRSGGAGSSGGGSGGGGGSDGGGSGGSGGSSEAQLYLKDWHFQSDSGAVRDPAAYRTPPWFSDDWLNAWCDAGGGCGGGDYRFVYIGGAGTLTPLHHDVLRSYSWSANIVGRKHWVLFPPGETPKLIDSGGNLVPDVRDGEYDVAAFPWLAGAARAELVQGPGEALFVPSGWHHQVTNLGDGSARGGGGGGLTASVNHNWLNAHALLASSFEPAAEAAAGAGIAAFLAEELRAARGAIAHERDAMGDAEWCAHAALVMRANCGMDHAALLRLLAVGAETARASPGGARARRHALDTIAAVLRGMVSSMDPPVMEHLFVGGSAEEGRRELEALLACAEGATRCDDAT